MPLKSDVQAQQQTEQSIQGAETAKQEVAKSFSDSLKENVEVGDMDQEDADAINAYYQTLQQKVNNGEIDKNKAAKMFDKFLKKIIGE